MRFRSLVSEKKIFFTLHVLLLIAGIYPLVTFEKVPLLLRINSFYHPLLDLFFYYAAFLGSKELYLLLMVTLLMRKQNIRTLIVGIGSFATMGGIIQGMKILPYFDQREFYIIIH